MDMFSFITQINVMQALVLLLGVALVIVEMFHPGFGAPGISGSVLIVLGIIMIVDTLLQALILIILILAILGIALSIVLHSATSGRLSRSPIILTDVQHREAGYIGTHDLDYFLDKVGVSLTVLRPSGVANFDGVKIDVVSEGEFIPQGTRIKVMKVVGGSIVVRQI